MRIFILFLTSSLLLADASVLDQARHLQQEYRQGNPAVARPLVAMLEKAVVRSPHNAELWEALGHACMSLEGSIAPTPDNGPALLSNAHRARDAYARSLELEPDNPLALASHGMARLVVAQFERDAAGAAAGIQEMNEAIRQAPKSITVRLTRAFTTIHIPPAMRDSDAVIEDLEFILDHAPGGRPEDVLHVLLGDVYAETGKPDSARAEYRQVTGASAFAADQVKLRLVALDKSAISPAAIAQVREGTGTRCAMCHAAGNDL
jgi:hypothetical protein